MSTEKNLSYTTKDFGTADDILEGLDSAQSLLRKKSRLQWVGLPSRP